MASAYPSVMTNAEVYHAWNGSSGTVCMSLESQPKGGAIWSGKSPLHGSLQILMVQLILMNVIYLAVYFALRPFKQSKFVCSVLAGILLRNTTKPVMNFQVEGEILMKTLGYLGMTLFIFLTAVKMDPKMIPRTAKKATILGLLSLLLPFGCVFLLVLRAKDFSEGGHNKAFRYLFAAGLSVTRFTNTAYAFEELNLLTSKLGQLVMSSTMVDEIFTWFSLLIGISFRQSTGKGLKVPLSVLLYIVALVLFTVFILRPLLVTIVKKTPQGKPVKPIITLGVLLMALMMAFMTDLIGATHMGALILGLAVPDGPPLGSNLVKMAELFVMDYLMPLFYVLIGYNVSIFTLFDSKTYNDKLLLFIMSVVLASITKFIGAVIAAVCSKLSHQHAVLVGLMMNLKGPMDLYLFYRWSTKKELTEGNYAVLVLSHVLLTAVVTSLIDRLYNSKGTMASYRTTKTMREMQTNPSNGELRILCCIHRDEDIPIFLSLLEATNPTSNSPTCAYVADLNNLEGRAVPMVSHDIRKMRRVQSNRSDCSVYEFEKYAADSNGLVTTKMYTMIAPYKSMHDNICSLAQEEKITLIVAPFHKNYPAIDIYEVGGIRVFNSNLQNISPCTVGILVDKGMSQFVSMSSYGGFSCKVAVLFIGGADDREAVTFATRMLGNSSITVTMLRLEVTDYYNPNNNNNNNNHKNKDESDDIEERIEKKLDDAVIHNFKVKSANNYLALYREVTAEGIDEAMNGIRTLGSGHNLILVGRQRHVVGSIFDEALLEWSDNPELGVIGDFVASADFQDGKTSVLVMQRCSRNGFINSI